MWIKRWCHFCQSFSFLFLCGLSHTILDNLARLCDRFDNSFYYLAIVNKVSLKNVHNCPLPRLPLWDKSSPQSAERRNNMILAQKKTLSKVCCLCKSFDLWKQRKSWIRWIISEITVASILYTSISGRFSFGYGRKKTGKSYFCLNFWLFN